ncbi:MAG: HD domain-containing protein [Acidobacteria bacterium]|nr:HD domain-containing protein [Acidobacteriota bacterium]
MTGLLDAIEREARTFFENGRGCHGWDHTRRVLALARRIAGAEDADPVLVTAGALLHDIGRSREDASGGKVCHAKAGAELARQVLHRIGAAPGFIDQVAHCVASHRYRGHIKPATLEARVVHDADKLDAMGAVGIGRAFQFAGEVGARLHDPGIDVEKTASYTVEDTAYREFLVKLSRLRERMLTDAGRRLAEERHTFMEAFFDRLNREVLGEC